MATSAGATWSRSGSCPGTSLPGIARLAMVMASGQTRPLSASGSLIRTASPSGSTLPTAAAVSNSAQRRLAWPRFHPPRHRRREPAIDAVAGLCQAICARPYASHRAHLWRQRLVLQLRAQHRGNHRPRLRIHRLNLAHRRRRAPSRSSTAAGRNGTAAWPDMGKLAPDIARLSAPRHLDSPPRSPQRHRTPLLVARRPLRLQRADPRASLRPDHPRSAGKNPRQDPPGRRTGATRWSSTTSAPTIFSASGASRWARSQPCPAGRCMTAPAPTPRCLADLYALLREAGRRQVLIDGCNTVGHLGQGVFDLQRTGDDTSGRHWERTRRMGVHRPLPPAAERHLLRARSRLIPITEALPWELSRQWLDVVAQSGTATIVSAGPQARGVEQRAALRQAFAIAAAGGVTARPVDWLATSTPERWQEPGKAGAQKQWRYRWSGAEGASAFFSP